MVLRLMLWCLIFVLFVRMLIIGCMVILVIWFCVSVLILICKLWLVVVWCKKIVMLCCVGCCGQMLFLVFIILGFCLCCWSVFGIIRLFRLKLLRCCNSFCCCCLVFVNLFMLCGFLFWWVVIIVVCFVLFCCCGVGRLIVVWQIFWLRCGFW